MTKLHVFDMDGTLLRGAAVEEISRHLGCFEQASALEQSWLRGEVFDEPNFWEQVLDLWSGANEDELDSAFEHAPWMLRVREVFADISHRGEYSVVISQSPLFIVRRLQRWGVQASYATTVEHGIPCRADQLLLARHKVDITLALLSERGLTCSDCVAYGDSSSDIELFKVLDRTVAINARPFIRAIASEVYDGDDMWSAYEIGRSLLERPASAWSKKPGCELSKG